MQKRSWRQEGVLLLLAALIIALDQLSKQWIRSMLSLGESLPPFGPLTIVHIQNTGSAFGLFTSQTALLTVFALAGLVAIVWFYPYVSQLTSWGSFSLALIFAGATGNLIDRLRMGYVTDFIYVRLWSDVYWPAFNVADSCITVGTIVLAISILFTYKKKNDRTAEAREKNIPG
jgi:signal peptidase II